MIFGGIEFLTPDLINAFPKVFVLIIIGSFSNFFSRKKIFSSKRTPKLRVVKFQLMCSNDSTTMEKKSNIIDY